MSSVQSDEEFHAQNCATRKVWTAAIFVAFSALMFYFSWRDLGKPYREPRLQDLFWYVVTIAATYKMFLIFTCIRERVVIAASMLIQIRGVALKILPGFLIPLASPVRHAFLALWAVALLISLTLLASAATAPRTSYGNG